MPNNILVNEKLKPNPLTHYSKNNLKAETEILNLSSSKFHVNVMRQGTIFGYSPRMRLDLVINNFVYSYLKYGYIKILRSGRQQRPFLHIKDTCRFMHHLLKHNYESYNNEIFNVGSSINNISILELKTIFESILKKRIKYKWYGENDFRSYKLSFEKINSIGFDCKYDIKYGIIELMKKLKNYQAGDANYTLKWYKTLHHWNDLTNDLSVNGDIFI